MQTIQASQESKLSTGSSASALRPCKAVLCGAATQALPLRWSGAKLALEIHQVSSFSVEEEERVAALKPDCALVNASDPTSLEVCRALRLSATLRSLPIIAFVEDPWSDQPRTALRVGADDFLPYSRLGSLSRKLLAIRQRGPSATCSLSGKALLADPDPGRRAQLGRQLQRLGLQVIFAVDLEQDLRDPALRLVVAHADLLPGDLQAGLERKQGPGGDALPWIICGRGEFLRGRSRTVVTPQVGFFDLGSDPSQIAFVANRLLHREPAIPRASERLSLDRPVHVNPHNEAAFWGFTYNISDGGLYVRTLTPPQVGVAVSLEFQPPHGNGRVIVEGLSVWRQVFCGAHGYPPGFGLRFTSASVADAAALRAGYQKLLEEQGDLLR